MAKNYSGPLDRSASASENAPSSASAARPLGDEQFGCAFTETGSVTIAALLHLLRLMGSELVLNQANCETESFERAVRVKIGQFLSPTTNQHARDAGLAYARHLVEQVMAQIRAQAQLQKSITSGLCQPTEPKRSPHLPKFLN